MSELVPAHTLRQGDSVRRKTCFHEVARVTVGRRTVYRRTPAARPVVTDSADVTVAFVGGLVWDYQHDEPVSVVRGDWPQGEDS